MFTDNIVSNTYISKTHKGYEDDRGPLWKLFADSPIPSVLVLKHSGKIIRRNKAFLAYTSHIKETCADIFSWFDKSVRKKGSKENLRRLIASIEEYHDCRNCAIELNIPGMDNIQHEIDADTIDIGGNEQGYLLLRIHRTIQDNDRKKNAVLNAETGQRLKDIQRKEEVFRKIFDAANVGLWECNLATNEININLALKNILDYEWTELSSVELIKKTVHPDDFEACFLQYENHRNGNTDNFCVEHRVKDSKGRTLWFLTSGKIIEYTASGKPLKLVGIAQNIQSLKQVEHELRNYRDHLEDLIKQRTSELMGSNVKLHQEIEDHKKSKEALHESQQRLELALEGGDLGYWDYDVKKDELIVSDKLCDIIGYKRGSLKTDYVSLSQLIHKDDLSHILKAQYRHLRGDDPIYEIEFRVLRGDDNWIWVFVKGKVVEYDEEGLPVRAAGTLLDITSRKKMEARLKENEDRYWNLFNNMGSGVAIYETVDKGINFILKDFNKAAEIIDTLDRDKIKGKNLCHIYPSAEENGIAGMLRRIYKTGEPESMQAKVYRDDSTESWRSLYCYKLPSRELVLIYDDLSEKKYAEEEVRKHKKNYWQLVENISEGICVIDDKALTKFVSPSMADLLGYSIDDMLGKPLHYFMSEHFIAIYEIHLRRLELGYKEQGDFEFIHKNGSLVYTRMESSPLRDSEENYIGAIASVMDITEHKRIDEQLKSTGRLLKTVFNSIQDNVAVIDRGYNILMSNIKDHDSLVSRDSNENMHCYEYLMDKDKPCKDCPAAEVFKTGAFKIFERKNNSDNRIFDVRMFPILDDNGSVTMVVQHLRDISDIKIAEERIRSSLQEKEVLLKEIHHRVKNNMQIISSILNLQSRYIRDKKDTEIFKESQNRVRAMALVHEKLYQSSDLANIDFSLYINEFTSYLFYSYNIDPERITLRVNVEDISFSIDVAIPLAQIINEVISNSIKHAFPGNRKGMIFIMLYKEPDGTYVLLIQDNGIGFPDELDTKKAETLGLQLIHALVLQLQGTISVNTKGGTTFIIKFK